MDNSDKPQALNVNSDYCPCGSGRVAINCCLTQRVNTTPSLPLTGYSHPSCYARAIHDCDKVLTREHFHSRSVLQLIMPEGQISMAAAPWLKPGERKTIPIEALASKVLCGRHNAALSGLDGIGKKFFEYLMGINVPSPFLLINGDELERWMLKVLCGGLASGGWGRTARGWQPPTEWLEILFGSSPLPESCGLYVLSDKTVTVPFYSLLTWPMSTDSEGDYDGIQFMIAGFRFMFFMSLPTPLITEGIARQGWTMNYRPECLVVYDESSQREIHFGPSKRSGVVTIGVLDA